MLDGVHQNYGRLRALVVYAARCAEGFVSGFSWAARAVPSMIAERTADHPLIITTALTFILAQQSQVVAASWILRRCDLRRVFVICWGSAPRNPQQLPHKTGARPAVCLSTSLRRHSWAEDKTDGDRAARSVPQETHGSAILRPDAAKRCVGLRMHACIGDGYQ